VSLGFGNGDPVFILNSGGTFVSSTTWIGTDNAGCNQGNTIVSFTHGISNIQNLNAGCKYMKVYYLNLILTKHVTSANRGMCLYFYFH